MRQDAAVPDIAQRCRISTRRGPHDSPAHLGPFADKCRRAAEVQPFTQISGAEAEELCGGFGEIDQAHVGAQLQDRQVKAADQRLQLVGPRDLLVQQGAQDTIRIGSCGGRVFWRGGRPT